MPITEYRTSVSDAHLFREEPALWLLKHHPEYRYRTESGPAAMRGLAVEHGFHAMLRFGLNAEQGAAVALRHYLRLAGRNAELDAFAEEAEDIPGYMRSLEGVIAGLELTRPIGVQTRVFAEVAGIPCLGFIDFQFPDFDIDLKTTGRCPSEMRDTHQEQLAFYSTVTGRPMKCVYVTPKKFAAYDLTDDLKARGYARLEATVRAIRTALQLDWDTLFSLYAPRDPAGFRWDEHSRWLASNIWNV